MAMPTIANLNTAMDNMFAAIDGTALSMNSSKAAATLASLQAFLLKAYTPLVDFVVTDAVDATVAAFFASTGQLFAALGRVPQVGDVFQVGGVGDTTDNALQAAKGSAVADGDIFAVSNVATPAVVYLGVAATPLDFSGEEYADFIW